MPLTRRHLLRQTATLATAATLAPRTLAQSTARLTLDPSRTLATIPPNFLGLGYEISSVTRPGLLSPENHAYIHLLRTLGPNGVLRIGGNTADFARFSPEAPAVSSPTGTVLNTAALKDLRGFLDATSWQLIWSLNLGAGHTPADIDAAVNEASAVSDIIGPRLLAVEIGNEPDLFFLEHRPKPYTYANFLADYIPVRNAVVQRLASLPIAGPDVAGSTDWVRRFATDQPLNLQLLTHHYYREGQNPSSTLAKLLAPDPKLLPLLTELRSVSDATGIPYRLCEVNSFSGGGRPGVSDTFASALWVLDYMLLLAQNGCAGINLETGVNQLGFVSSYSPIFENPDGSLTARPTYVGMLAFAQATGSASIPGDGLSPPPPNPGAVNTVIPCTLSSPTPTLTAYAIHLAPQNTITIILINKDPSTDQTLTLHLADGSTPATRARYTRLTAPALTSTTGLDLSTHPSGALTADPLPGDPAATPFHLAQTPITIPAASALLLQLST